MTDDPAPTHVLPVTVSFGDCDPAGIVFYPNLYRWFDRCFHDWLRGFGGHAAVCARIGAAGLGLTEAQARFRRPLRDGDAARVEMTLADWGSRSFRVTHRIVVDGALAVEGHEIRAVFRQTPAGLIAGAVTPLRDLVTAA